MPKLKMLGYRVPVSRRRQELKVKDPFYDSPAWREARALSIAMHAYRCARCGERPGRLFVDHIVERRDGGADLDQANLEPLCGACHAQKTLEQAKRRIAAHGPL